MERDGVHHLRRDWSEASEEGCIVPLVRRRSKSTPAGSGETRSIACLAPHATRPYSVSPVQARLCDRPAMTAPTKTSRGTPVQTHHGSDGSEKLVPPDFCVDEDCGCVTPADELLREPNLFAS